MKCCVCKRTIGRREPFVYVSERHNCHTHYLNKCLPCEQAGHTTPEYERMAKGLPKEV